jgi:hypothetical protein
MEPSVKPLTMNWISSRDSGPALSRTRAISSTIETISQLLPAGALTGF